MKRYLVRHCRDKAVKPGARWDVFEDDIADTHAKPVWLGFGTHEQCLAFAIGMAELRATTGVRS